MTGMSAGEPHEPWPPDLHERADAVLNFIVGHVLVQDELDDASEREIAQWIGLISLDLGGASAAHAARPGDADGERAAAAWLACAAADALRARLAFTPADRAEQIEHLHAHMVSVQMCQPAWRPAIQIAFVIAALGQLVEHAMPLMTADPDAHGPVPRFQHALLEVLNAQAPDPTADDRERTDADDPPDPVTDTAWTLDELAHTAAAAAVQLRPGGPVGMPDDTP